MPATSTGLPRVSFFFSFCFLLLRPLTVLMKQTRQAVCAVKQPIFLDVYESKPVKQEVNGTVILPPLVFPARTRTCLIILPILSCSTFMPVPASRQTGSLFWPCPASTTLASGDVAAWLNLLLSSSMNESFFMAAAESGLENR